MPFFNRSGCCRGHLGSVNSVDWHQDGNRLVSGGSDCTVILWNTRPSCVLVGTCRGHTDSVRSVAWSPSGDRIASASLDETVRIWKVDSCTTFGVCSGHKSCVTCVVWSPRGDRLASASLDGTVHLWDSLSCSIVGTLDEHSGAINCVAWTCVDDSEELLATGGSDGHVLVWDAKSCETHGTCQGHSDSVRSVAWARGGGCIASASRDATVMIWDAASCSLLDMCLGHCGAVRCVAWSPKDEHVASAADAHSVMVWDAASNTVVGTCEGHASVIHDLAWGRCGACLATASADGTVMLWCMEKVLAEREAIGEDPVVETHEGRLLGNAAQHDQQVRAELADSRSDLQMLEVSLRAELQDEHLKLSRTRDEWIHAKEEMESEVEDRQWRVEARSREEHRKLRESLVEATNTKCELEARLKQEERRLSRQQDEEQHFRRELFVEAEASEELRERLRGEQERAASLASQLNSVSESARAEHFEAQRRVTEVYSEAESVQRELVAQLEAARSTRTPFFHEIELIQEETSEIQAMQRTADEEGRSQLKQVLEEAAKAEADVSDELKASKEISATLRAKLIDCQRSARAEEAESQQRLSVANEHQQHLVARVRQLEEELEARSHEPFLREELASAIDERRQMKAARDIAEAVSAFRESLTNTYPQLWYEVEHVELLQNPPELKTLFDGFTASLPVECTSKERSRRWVFHTCSRNDVLEAITTTGMRPSHCGICRGVQVGTCKDCGWFGDHTKGVYVSKHADYTFYYQQDRAPQPGDRGKVVMLEMVTGKVRHCHTVMPGTAPSEGFHCHESPGHLEYFVWDDSTTAEPPGISHRCLPRHLIHWHAVGARYMIEHDGAIDSA
eukprot:TRINITY_DN61958_c0_g1_i1.p1 TRINITY_DN61958_c0_g1~~TRINITY_DN61958_c0_g1_i1.p1  ORF type:complete len:854 (-),score=132.87 TRINITY_DN61958_c0_g1_i1:49-2610(-)